MADRTNSKIAAAANGAASVRPSSSAARNRTGIMPGNFSDRPTIGNLLFLRRLVAVSAGISGNAGDMNAAELRKLPSHDEQKGNRSIRFV